MRQRCKSSRVHERAIRRVFRDRLFGRTLGSEPRRLGSNPKLGTSSQELVYCSAGRADYSATHGIRVPACGPLLENLVPKARGVASSAGGFQRGLTVRRPTVTGKDEGSNPSAGAKCRCALVARRAPSVPAARVAEQPFRKRPVPVQVRTGAPSCGHGPIARRERAKLEIRVRSSVAALSRGAARAAPPRWSESSGAPPPAARRYRSSLG
jgi:hypothetical protein